MLLLSYWPSHRSIIAVKERGCPVTCCRDPASNSFDLSFLPLHPPLTHHQFMKNNTSCHFFHYPTPSRRIKTKETIMSGEEMREAASGSLGVGPRHRPPSTTKSSLFGHRNRRLARSRVIATLGGAQPLDGLRNRCADKHRRKRPGHNEWPEGTKGEGHEQRRRRENMMTKEKMSGGVRNRLRTQAPWPGNSPMYNYTLVY